MEYYTVKEVALQAGLGYQSVLRDVKMSLLDHKMFNGVYMIPQDARTQRYIDTGGQRVNAKVVQRLERQVAFMKQLLMNRDVDQNPAHVLVNTGWESDGSFEDWLRANTTTTEEEIASFRADMEAENWAGGIHISELSRLADRLGIDLGICDAQDMLEELRPSLEEAGWKFDDDGMVIR